MRDTLGALRRPASTGARRCWPCTVLNVGLLVLACALVAFVSPAAAVVAGLVGAVAIALRGYLVPYTPRFAPRLAASLPGEVFHTNSVAPETMDSLSDGTNGEVVLDTLVETGVLVPDGETLRLSEGFRERWREEMAGLRAADAEMLAETAVAVAPTAHESELVDVAGDEWVVLTDESASVADERWLSRPTAIAEVAAVGTLTDDHPPELCVAAARPLRLFLERCPACESGVEETTAAACCGGPGPSGPDEVLACTACGRRLFTFS